MPDTRKRQRSLPVQVIIRRPCYPPRPESARRSRRTSGADPEPTAESRSLSGEECLDQAARQAIGDNKGVRKEAYMRGGALVALASGVFVLGLGLSFAGAQQKAQEPTKVVVYKSPT